MNLSEIIIVLSRPSEGGNIGAACRAMKNMGLSRLRIVAPVKDLDGEVIRARAVHAAEVWAGAESYDTLRAATADCSLVVGTTRRQRKRQARTLTPRELAETLKTRTGPVALVFGNERTGLETDELALCHLASHIPADAAFPSLNLSHAVQIYAYELYVAMTPTTGGHWVPLTAEPLATLAVSITDSLASVGFYTQAGREDHEKFFRDIFARAGLTLDESRYVDRIFRKAARLIDKQDGAGHT